MKNKKPLYILKIGGSVATYRNRPEISTRRTLLKEIAFFIKKAQQKKNFDLILIHGAGAASRQLVKEFELQKGTTGDAEKSQAALLSQVVSQKLNNSITEIFIATGIQVVPIHTASTTIQRDGKIERMNLETVTMALGQKLVPLLYGEVVFDETLGMSVCSGDDIAVHLSEKLKINKIAFASDVKGIFTKDPHLHPETQLIEEITLKRAFKKMENLKPHSIDVTNGLFGKIKNFLNLKNDTLELIEIFNGLEAQNYQKVLLGEEFPHTKIKR